MVAVRMEDLGRALGQLDDESRALLELSLRRGMPDDVVAATVSVDADGIEGRKSELLDRLASDLKLDGREQRDELFATLQDLPPQYWRGEG